MRILFLGDIVGPSGCNVVKRFLPDIIKKRDLDTQATILLTNGFKSNWRNKRVEKF